MKVGVTGGTGFVGSAIVSELAVAGHEVRILSRKAPERLPGGVRHVPGNVVTGDGLDVFADGVDALIHLVGIIKESGKNSFEAVHHEGTVNILEAATGAGVQRYLHMSALGTRKGAFSKYHRSKFSGEEAVRASGLDWTIFRPSTIYGPDDSFFNMLTGMLKRFPIFPVLGGGKHKMQPVFFMDVAASFRRALESDITIGKTYELAGPDVFTLKKILSIILKIIDKKRLLIPIPLILVSPPVKLAHFLGIPLPVTPDQLIMLDEDNIRTGGDPVEELGIEWASFEEGIRQYLGSRF